MENAEEPIIIEGFLCPICKTDLEDFVSLTSHFNEEHKEDLEVLKFFKDVFGKTKKILKLNKEEVDLSESKHELKDIRGSQGEVVSRKHTDMFKQMRSSFLERYATETNTLIIRLDKLLTDMPSDPVKKKAHEQSVVSWLDGEGVTRCPNCTKNFHLARRQHHCRLCGSIMCHDCSSFLPIYKAKQVLSRPIKEDDEQADDYSEQRSDTSEMREAKSKKTERSLRLCPYCSKLLETREQMKESRNCNTVITQLYQRLHEYITTVDEYAELYYKMSISLNFGDSTYRLKDAQDLWQKVMKLAETVDQYSAKIASLQGDENTVKKELQLRKAVRTGAVSYIQQRLLTLPPLPTEENYKLLQARRRKKIEEKLKDKARSDFKTETVDFKPVTSKVAAGNANKGWIPENTGKGYSGNPLVDQIINIRHYIKQARQEYKFDEAASLEKHLAELEEAYLKQQQNPGMSV